MKSFHLSNQHNRRGPRLTSLRIASNIASLALLCSFFGAIHSAEGLLMETSLQQRISALLTPTGRQRESLKAELIELVERSSPPGNSAGAFDNKEDGERFKKIFLEELPALNPTPNPAQSSLFSGEWDCLWTTEKEINFLVGSGLFGQKWKRSYQIIDVPGNNLENYILFENESDLSVGSSIKPDPDEGSRFDINFEKASLKWKGFKVNLPPVGSGWGELLYLDQDLRLQRDIRGDLILAQRVR